MLHADPTTVATDGDAFDFWLGTWDLRWTTPEGHPRAGTNVVERVLGGSAIRETFVDPVGPDGTGYSGLSLSTYDADVGLWRQTWVDSAGSHMEFRGRWHGDSMRLQRRAVVDGVDVVERMTWRSITDESFVWDWERSLDDGLTWDLMWRIDYRRGHG